MELTPEERERIYLEEKARLEFRQQLEPARSSASAEVATRPGNGSAAVLSLVIPGAGQMYKGRVSRGLLWMVGTLLGYSMMFLPDLTLMALAAVIVHLCCIFDAFELEPENLAGS